MKATKVISVEYTHFEPGTRVWTSNVYSDLHRNKQYIVNEMVPPSYDNNCRALCSVEGVPGYFLTEHLTDKVCEVNDNVIVVDPKSNLSPNRVYTVRSVKNGLCTVDGKIGDYWVKYLEKVQVAVGGVHALVDGRLYATDKVEDVKELVR